MLRRSHKKTKKGSKCEECRRRHIRCDQQRPSCINCRNSDRVCIYGLIDQRRAADASSSTLNTSSNENIPLALAPQQGETSQDSPPSHNSSARALDDSFVNIAHLELFNHFIQGSFLFIDRDTTFTDHLKKTALASAFSNPYLMHGILALSARHMSIQASPERTHHYLNQSTKLQTWAVANFNPAPPEPNQDTCVAILLFSSLTCIHSLSDISSLNLDSEPFLIRFGHYFGLQRGVRTVMSDHWSRLEESELQNLVEWCGLATRRKGQGSECDSIRQLVTESADVSPSALEACHLAIEQVQCILDECNPHQLMPVHCVYLTLAWPLLIHDKLVDLLVLRRPVALIILAYYGATLDLCGGLWMVGQTGKQIVNAVNMLLGPEWASLLRWPCDVVNVKPPQPIDS
ncbi:hypothetical protein F5Y09DRAFT_138504 [Xylaria sp. FL1042]|nr:hypothetical protein F5Y09DRAFT_138504 [Xylaria sp. FL1042]